MLHVLYEDNHCLAVLKPGGVLTQAPPGIPSMEEFVRAYLKERYDKTGHVYLGIPHRLDRPVSGVLLFARSTKAAQRLAEQFRERQVSKLYWAFVEHSREGSAPEDEGEWEDWMHKIKDEARSQVVTADAPGARRALLRYRVLKRSTEGTLLEIQPETGRMHQIRLQAARRGWPIRGDYLYGGRLPFGPPAELPRDRLIALHARTLTFLHPIRYEPVVLTADLPETWDSVS